MERKKSIDANLMRKNQTFYVRFGYAHRINLIDWGIFIRIRRTNHVYCFESKITKLVDGDPKIFDSTRPKKHKLHCEPLLRCKDLHQRHDRCQCVEFAWHDKEWWMEFFQKSLGSDRLVESQNRHRVRERVHFFSEETVMEKLWIQQDRKGTQDADCQLLGGHRGVR